MGVDYWLGLSVGGCRLVACFVGERSKVAGRQWGCPSGNGSVDAG